MAILRNGRLPASALLTVPWDRAERVRAYALPSLVALNAAFRAEFGHDLIINESYRDYETQERYYDNPPSGAGTAARPGTSNHGWGLAVDLKLRGRQYAWMLANAPRFGWVNPLWARDGRGIEEPWHWEHIGAPVVIPDLILPPDLNPDDLEEFTMADPKHLFRLPGTNALWQDRVIARGHVSRARYDLMDPKPKIVDLDPKDAFWTLPTVTGPGEVYELPGDPVKGALYVYEEGLVVHLTRERYRDMGKPHITTLAASNSLWERPRAR